ncbi:MAG: sugar ABC transporter substrate-binding protein [Anaerolineae bacterium]|nr:sugar ABC transporter substrate-binding protein [Anaerolineae bacterium]
MKRSVLLLVAILMLVTAIPVAAQEKPSLSIIWFEWPPCNALAELVKSYEEADITVTCIPWGQWHDQIFTDFAARGGADLPVLDSQFIGEAVAGNHIIELTDWMQENMDVETYVPAALTYYGEYPLGSGHYYGVPMIADVMVLVYRTDLFEAAGFEPAATWTETLEQAKFFKESDLVENGWTWFWCGAPACGDQLQVAVNQIIWSWGGELWDPETYAVEGVINSPENAAALEFSRELYLTGPEGAGNFTYNEVVDGMCNGTAAMTAIWVGFAASLVNPESCPQAENLGFAVPPGETEHYLSLGGQPISVSAYSQNEEAALEFMKWLQSYDIQIEWVKLLGYSARTDVLASEEFQSAAPYNPIFAEAYQLVKDFWNLPEYQRMLELQGEYMNLAVTGQMDVQEALDLIAEEHQAIIDEAYPDGPPAQ